MLKEYKQVDENGYIIENFVFNTEIDEIPEDCKETWNPHEVRFVKPRYNFGTNQWMEGVSENDILLRKYGTIEQCKENKDAELNKACSEAILNGFDYSMDGVTYRFSYDREAQTNFQETYILFQNGVIQDVMWTVTLNDGKFRLFLDKDRFAQIYYASVQHKLGCIKKYRDNLTSLLTGATTYDMINSIEWNGVVSEIVPIITNRTIDNKIVDLANESQMTMMALIELSTMVMT